MVACCVESLIRPSNRGRLGLDIVRIMSTVYANVQCTYKYEFSGLYNNIVVMISGLYLVYATKNYIDEFKVDCLLVIYCYL